MNIEPIAFAFLTDKGEVAYTSNLEGPYPELVDINRWGRKGAMIQLLSDTQHRAHMVVTLMAIKNAITSGKDPLQLIDSLLKENMR
jgi:hypothetical protein